MTVLVAEVLLELGRAKELRILVALLVALDILHKREPGLVGMPLLLMVGSQEQSWHQLRNHRPELHILSSSSFHPRKVARRLQEARLYLRSLAAEGDHCIEVVHRDRPVDIRHEGLP
jgi:hypothetical protein